MDFNLGEIIVPRTFHQLGILILDGSGSMGAQTAGKISKADAVNMAVRELLTRLQVSKNKKNFSIAVVTYDQQAQIHTPITEVETINDNADYNPMNGHGGGTDIGAGILQGYQIAQQFLSNVKEGDVPHSVVMVVMTDGECQKPDSTREIASMVRQNANITLCTTLFATIGEANPNAQTLMQEIASSPAQYKTVYDAESLRKFFIASVSSGKNVNIQ
jgi:Mg-chelatase subunit ChlD